MEVFWMWIVVVFLQALLIVICFSLSVLMKCLLDRPGTLPTHQRRRRNNNNNNGHQSGQQSTSQGDSISVISSSSSVLALPPPYEEVIDIDLDALPKYEDLSQLNLKGQKPVTSV